MSDLTIEVPTTKSMDELRPRLDEALRLEFPGGMMKSRWEGDVLLLSGPGAEGSVVVSDGKLQGQATLRPPASMMRPVIEKKMTKVLARAAEA